MIGSKPSPRVQLLGAMALALSLLLTACSGGSSSTAKATHPPLSAGTATTMATANAASTIQTASGSNSRPVSTGGDICGLVTKAEAAALVGRDVHNGEATSSQEGRHTESGCSYRTDASPTMSIVNVLLVKNVSHDEFLESVARAPDAIDQPGIGEDAKFVPGLLSVYDPNRVLTVGIVVDGKGAPATTLIPVAKKALGRL